jgi:release factor glutamine methyltransferase
MNQEAFTRRVERGISRDDAVALATDWLSEAGCPTPRADAEAIITAAPPIQGQHSTGIDPEAGSELVALCGRRARREPLPYILGRTAFCGLDLLVDKRVFIPRPEASMLVDVATALPAGARFHEVATGSGAIALAVKSQRPDLSVTASDISTEAIEVAALNGKRLGLDVLFTVASFLPEGSYDLVSANLPCAPEHHLVTTMPPEEAQFEPRVALTAGADGLDAIRTLLRTAPGGTLIALQHIPEQTDAIMAWLDEPETRTSTDGRACMAVGRVKSNDERETI